MEDDDIMAYTVHNFETGGTIKATDFNEMDAQIKALTDNAGSASGGSGVTYESYTLEEDKQFVEADLNGYEELSIVMKVPAGATYTYGHLCRDGGLKSGFATTNWRDETKDVYFFVSIRKIADCLWHYRWKKGNEYKYSDTMFNDENGFTTCFLTVNPTSFGVCSYSGCVLPVGTEFFICRGRAL